MMAQEAPRLLVDCFSLPATPKKSRGYASNGCTRITSRLSNSIVIVCVDVVVEPGFLRHADALE